MPKRDKKFRTPFGLNAWGLEQLRKYNARQEESARFAVALEDAEERRNAQLAVDYDAQALETVERLRCLKKMKKSKKKLVFVTLNYNEKLVTPTGTVPFVKRILDHDKVTQGIAYWEWRDPVKETGLHTHIVLQGDTRRIMEFCKRTKGPFIKLCKDYDTLLKYDLKYWNEKVKYADETFDENKNEIKKHYKSLRLKYELPNISK